MNRYIIFIPFFLLLIFSSEILSQNKTEFSSELFQIYLDNVILTVGNNEGVEIYTREFQNPTAYTFDIDRDGVDELFVIDKNETEYFPEYILYIYNLIDTFYLSANINSGNIEPYHTTSGEIEGLIIVTGNSDFSYLSDERQDPNEGNEIESLPINCWKYEDGEVFSVNEDLYEIFILENENLLGKLEKEDVKSCGKSKQLKTVIASVYINYLNAGENASAENLLETFYLCDDLNSFREELDKLFTKEFE